MASVDWVHLLQFLFITALYLFDMGTDWNFFASVYEDYNSFKRDVENSEANALSMCTCECTADDYCTPTSMNGGTLMACDAFSSYTEAVAMDDSYICEVPQFLTRTSKVGNVCEFSFINSRPRKLVEELGKLSYAVLGINIVITPLVIYYLYWLLRRKSIKEEIAALEEQAKEQVEEEHSEQSKCYNCLTELNYKERFCPTCGAKQEGFTQDTHQGKHMRIFFKRFIGIMHLRMIFLLFEDLPLLLLLIRYVVIVDSGTGLGCRYRAYDGALGSFEEPSVQSTVVISALGTLASAVVFLVQMMIVNYKNYRIRKTNLKAQRVHLCGITGVFAAIFVLSLVVAPVLFVLGGTAAKEVLALSKSSVTIVFVVGAILSLPILLFIYMFFVFVIEEFGYDSSNIAPLCDEGDWCCECNCCKGDEHGCCEDGGLCDCC
eukprot:m.18013 g.18013  ORF g.18013 m.18013 type:complete len:433 (+) comp8232_c0_seq2:117-1415(+)